MKKLIAFTIVLLMVPGMSWGVTEQTSWAYWVENVDSSKLYVYSWDMVTIVDSQAGGPRTSSLLDYDTTLRLNLTDSSYRIVILRWFPGADGESRWTVPYRGDSVEIKTMLATNPQIASGYLSFY